MPLIYDHEQMKDRVKVPLSDTMAENIGKLEKLFAAFQRLQELCALSTHPIRCCKRRYNCCGRKMISLFHEPKQMGIVLRKSFNGTHIWIPSDFCYDKTGLPSEFEPVKIDSMFFPATEEPVSFDQG